MRFISVTYIGVNMNIDLFQLALKTEIEGNITDAVELFSKIETALSCFHLKCMCLFDQCGSIRSKKLTEGDYSILSSYYRPYQDDPRIQRKLGYLYYKCKEYNQAYKWLITSEEHPIVQYYIGKLFYSGELDTNQRYEQAYGWFEKSAKQCWKIAQHKLASMYYYGEFVDQDYDKAYYWSKLSANQNYVRAQVSIGHAYLSGNGVKQDGKHAFYWFKLAADQGSEIVYHDIGSMYYECKVIESNFEEAFKWWSLAAAKNYYPSYHQLGRMYQQGQWVKQDYSKAFEYYLLSG